jgi:hypothetical protein
LVGPVNSYLGFFRLTRTWRRNNFLDGSGHDDTRRFRMAVFNFSSAIRADLEMRGFAISFLTLARVALTVFVFVAFLFVMHPT